MFARNSNSVSRCCDLPDPLLPPLPPGMRAGGGRGGGAKGTARAQLAYSYVLI